MVVHVRAHAPRLWCLVAYAVGSVWRLRGWHRPYYARLSGHASLG